MFHQAVIEDDYEMEPEQCDIKHNVVVLFPLDNNRTETKVCTENLFGPIDDPDGRLLCKIMNHLWLLTSAATTSQLVGTVLQTRRSRMRTPTRPSKSTRSPTPETVQ